MKARTELFLYQLLWTAEMATQPTFRNLSGSFEAWAYRNGFLRQVHELERRNILESATKPDSTERVFRLTQSGRILAAGGRDPEALWARPWDGKWRMVVFDLPESQRALRQKLRRTLRAAHLGCLQQSVWVTPDHLDSATDLLRSLKVDAGALVFFEGHPCGGENDADLAFKAWDFSVINRLYTEHSEHLQRFATVKKQTSPDKLLAWLSEERNLWRSCLFTDPLLPNVLLPKGYLGQKAWTHRQTTLAKFAQHAKSFTDKV